jgi:putative tryptophan/tyrosine transport system substrate-binding protein
MIRRREFITLLGSAAGWPLVASAQQSAMPVIGFLHSGSPGPNGEGIAAFRRGLADAGFIENKNVTIEYRWAFNQFARLPNLAADLVGLQPKVILAAGSLGPALAAKRATSTIPIVFQFGADPVKYGLVASLNRPGGNITGMAYIATELAGKRLQLLHELVPQTNAIAFLAGTPNYTTYQEQTSLMLQAGQALGLQILIVECRDDRDFEEAFATMVERRVGALIIGTFPFANLNKVVALAARHSIPTMYPGRGFVVDGGLVSYGSELTTYQLATQYVARILKGTKPADLPVQQSTKFELIINLTTAKALGLTIPPTLYALADEIIE